jgi:hypothetical protein
MTDPDRVKCAGAHHRARQAPLSSARALPRAAHCPRRALSERAGVEPWGTRAKCSGAHRGARSPCTVGPPGRSGAPPTRVVRASAGNVSHDAVSRFPHSYRALLGQTDYYRDRDLPYPHALERGA